MQACSYPGIIPVDSAVSDTAGIENTVKNLKKLNFFQKTVLSKNSKSELQNKKFKAALENENIIEKQFMANAWERNACVKAHQIFITSLTSFSPTTYQSNLDFSQKISQHLGDIVTHINSTFIRDNAMIAENDFTFEDKKDIESLYYITQSRTCCQALRLDKEQVNKLAQTIVKVMHLFDKSWKCETQQLIDSLVEYKNSMEHEKAVFLSQLKDHLPKNIHIVF